MDSSDVFVCFLPYYLATPRPTDATTFRIAKGISQLQIVVRIQAYRLLFFFILVGHLFFIHQAQCHLVIFFLSSDAALLFQLVIRLHATGGVSQPLWLQWFVSFFSAF